MGQFSSSTCESVKILQQEVVSHVGQLNQLLDAALCTYDEFLLQIQELNSLANKVMSEGNTRLTIGVKRGTADKILLWRATVRIAVILWDNHDHTIISKRLLTLPQFLRVSNTIKQHLDAAYAKKLDENSGSAEMKRDLTFSRLFDEVDAIGDSLTECCICLERKPDVMLPCAHTYCLPCIEQWNTNNKTCPICRETVDTTDDAWVLSEPPESEDVHQEIYSNLLNLSKEP